MIIKKIVAPSNLEREKYLTLWHADLEIGQQLWVQSSKDEEHTKWIRLGDMLEQLAIMPENEALLKEFVRLIS